MAYNESYTREESKLGTHRTKYISVRSKCLGGACALLIIFVEAGEEVLLSMILAKAKYN